MTNIYVVRREPHLGSFSRQNISRLLVFGTPMRLQVTMPQTIFIVKKSGILKMPTKTSCSSNHIDRQFSMVDQKSLQVQASGDFFVER